MSSQSSPYRDNMPAERAPAAGRWLPTQRLGVLLAAGAVACLAGMLWSPLTWLAAAWWAGLLMAAATDVRALRLASKLTARRTMEHIMSLGVENEVAPTIRNHTGAAFRCLLRDEPPLDFAVDRLRLAGEVAAGGELVARYRATPPRRGDFPFGQLNARLTCGFGLIARQLRFDLDTTVKVYPNVAGIRAHEIAARKERLGDIGIHASRLKGTGLQFESLRAYVPGDELRRVDWKATARRAAPITREYDVERSQHIMICLDLGRTMASTAGRLTKTDHAVNAAALLAYVAAKTGDWVGLYAFAQGPTMFVPPRKHQFSQVLDHLYGLQPSGTESNYYQSFMHAARRIRKRSLIVLFTDLVDPDSSARLLNHVTLLTRRHLVLCAALADYELYDLAAKSPAGPHDLYERTVATALLTDRLRALNALRHRGAIALDATPTNLSVQVVNQYLDLKAHAAL